MPPIVLQMALDAVDERISDVQISQAKSSDPEIEAPVTPDDDAFDDAAVATLFDSLR